MDLEEQWQEIQPSPMNHGASLSHLACTSHSRLTPLMVELTVLVIFKGSTQTLVGLEFGMD